MKILGTTPQCASHKEESYYTQLATKALLVTNQIAQFMYYCQKAQYYIYVENHESKCLYIYICSRF